uniref:chitinase n=1 Tax=Cajanus cajan TaxID=3821 RepID=A0A151R5B0_CAJCA|nr:Acidic endochitinase [Cajanus cajan]
MAYKMQASVIFLLSLFSFSSSSPDNGNGGIAVYWGQNNGDGDLISTCDTNKYKIVLLAFLNKFGGGRTPAWNFAGHCDNGAWKKCYELEPEIKHCQAKGIKVLLSIGGAPDYSDYSISSADDAKIVANYLYENFLSGQFGPLGSVTLDGIDFDIEKTEDHWDDLARELDTLRRTKGRYFYLSAAPQCPIPVYYLGKAIATGLFDYIFVQFYNNPDAAWIGYIEPQKLITEVLPHVKLAPNYGGVMLWDRYRDVQNNYSGQILPYVFTTTSLSDAIYECVSNAFHRLLTLSPYAAN